MRIGITIVAIALVIAGCSSAAPLPPPPRIVTQIQYVRPELPDALKEPCSIPVIGNLKMVSDLIMSLADYQSALKVCRTRHQAVIDVIEGISQSATP